MKNFGATSRRRVLEIAPASWSAPVLWSFAQAKGHSKAPEDRRTPKRKALLLLRFSKNAQDADAMLAY
ncbi:MAG: hypothetical protein B7Z37_17675 [Verrucomicrobia bacterium 12-59-8]|nr:MAG: hypothetical protein B7Z37_17675 [Verrucomicrobia bacterium 12-59-8]